MINYICSLILSMQPRIYSYHCVSVPSHVISLVQLQMSDCLYLYFITNTFYFWSFCMTCHVKVQVLLLLFPVYSSISIFHSPTLFLSLQTIQMYSPITENIKTKTPYPYSGTTLSIFFLLEEQLIFTTSISFLIPSS